jgi:N-acetylglutamate synthase-like GNAT family acetyltransferase
LDPSGVRIRPAGPADRWAIRRLIWRVGINPIGLDWRRFLVAIDEQGRLLGCGQIKPHRDGSRELASIAVQPGVQQQGIGSAIIMRLLDGQPLPLYLTCRHTLESYYQRFGFRAVDPETAPPYFRRIWRLVAVFQRLMRSQYHLLVMVKES